jgi:hypothetical protein
MRLGIGVAILLYGLLLSLNTTAPVVAELAGNRVSISLRGDLSACSRMMGNPPFGGVYGSCPAEWNGQERGKIFGKDVAKEVAAGVPLEAYRYPLFSDLANLAPDNTDKVAGIVAILIVMLGILISVTERRRGRTAAAAAAAQDEQDDAEVGVDAPRRIA